jgi:hypothetical protein
MIVLSRRTLAALVSAAVVAAGVAAPSSEAAAGGVAAPGSDAAAGGSGSAELSLRRMQRQRPLVAAASAIRWEIERHTYAGFAGISLEDSYVALWWKGAVPPSMAAVVAASAKSAPVQVKRAAHSLAELTAAARKMRASVTVAPDAALHSIKLPADGSGLVVGAALPPGPGALAAAAARVPDVGVPVTVVHEAPLAPMSRDDDAPPWSGGAAIVNTNRRTLCSSGFGVRNGSNAKYILTAAHCGQVGERYTDLRGEFIGNVGPRNQDHDVELVPTSNVNSRIYTGDRNSNNVLPVTGWDWTFIGEYLCQSGVTSAGVLGGPVCDLKVLFYWDDREDLVEAEQAAGQVSCRAGDSGGPIYSVSGGAAIAKGTVTRGAGARIGFQDFGTAWRDFGVTPAS